MVQVAKFLGTRHFSFEFTVQQGLDVLNDVIYHLETFDVTTVSLTNHSAACGHVTPCSPLIGCCRCGRARRCSCWRGG